MYHAVQDGRRGPGAERSHPRCRVGHHAAEREHVAPRPRAPALGLLGRHVARRAEHHPSSGQRGAVGGARDAEVDDPRPVGGQQDVGGLEVAVHHAAGVDGLQRLDQPGQQRPQRLLGQRPVFPHDLIQRGPWHERGGQPRRPLVQPARHDRRSVDAADRAGRGHLLAEPAQEVSVAGQVRVHDLDRHRPAGRGEPEVDPAHAARAELRAQPVLADHARIVRGQWLHQLPQGKVPRFTFCAIPGEACMADEQECVRPAPPTRRHPRSRHPGLSRTSPTAGRARCSARARSPQAHRGNRASGPGCTWPPAP